MTGHRYKILAVDDEEDVLDVLKRVLEEYYEVYTAASGDLALEVLKKQPIDMLITDQRMPQMSGIKLIEQAKRINPQMVRIILTGYTDPKDLVDAINRGEVYRYITKPWDLNDLLFTIRDALENYQLRRDKEGLLLDLKMRINAMTVLLELSKASAQARSHADIIEALFKFLPSIVQFDACASVIEHDAWGRSLLSIHCQKVLSEQKLREIRNQVLESYHLVGEKRVREENLVLRVTGEQGHVDGENPEFRSTVSVPLSYGHEPTGLIQLFSFAEDFFREDTKQLLDVLANQTSETIRTLRTHLSIERQRLELMVQSLADGVIMVDEGNRVFVINPAARRLLHLSPDTPVDTKYLKETLGFYPFDLVRGWSTHDSTMVREEIRVFDVVLDSIVSPVSMGDQLVGVAVVLRDITQEKLLEERKEEFVSIISHELRTPLTSIGGALDLLLHRYAGEINPKQERYLQLAKGSCDKLNFTIDELLDLSRFEKGKMQMDMGKINLSDLIVEAVENYQAASLEKQLNLHVKGAAEKILVKADRNRLHQVLNNLLSNALKFTQAGGEICVELFRTDALPSFIGICVFNNGQEIDEQDHERIFDKFEQARLSRVGMVAGSGLGLSISKSIVEAHGGCIWVESGRGQGTRFIFTLPELKETDALSQEEHKAPQVVSVRFKSPPRILVVDDDLSSTYVIKGVLIAHGYSVMVAHQGREAIRLARERRPDLIVMDIRMPQIDGLEATDILHHDPETRDIPVLMLSVMASEAEAFQAGASAYMKKPVTIEDLFKTVQRLLEERNLLKRMFQVLIVDDDPAICAICKEALEAQGYAVIEARNGEEALNILSSQTVDVILLDILLPDFDGFQITERIREDRRTAHVPIIFISARGGTSDKVRAFKLGGDDYMVKPFDALELGARVESVIKRKEREFDSSPTTKLPGSVALDRELNRRLAAKQPFTLCYLDLDNLKAFNDYYGYAKADGVIQQTGDLIRNAVEKYGTPSDFVAHIAGDDFVVVAEPRNLETISKEIIQNFDRVIPLYYREEDQARGYIEAEDRFGQQRRFGIMSISLAAVNVEPDQFRSHAEISARAAVLKKRAKSIPGSVLVQGGANDEEQKSQ
jgi:CheY-like chemotaxis protein/GGDEF domain-containing protein